MADKDLWTTFERTGSVMDYLNYKGIQVESNQNKAGECTVEPGSQSDGHDTVRSSYR